MSELLYCWVTRRDGPWKITIHGSHGSDPAQRKHVHITRTGMPGQYSWNIDGTRHDAHKFPVSEQQIRRAKGLAAEALNIPATMMQFMTAQQGGIQVSVAHVGPARYRRHLMLNTYIGVRECIAVFGTKDGSFVVIVHEIESS